jgi:RNase P subunit RPR2
MFGLSKKARDYEQYRELTVEFAEISNEQEERSPVHAKRTSCTKCAVGIDGSLSAVRFTQYYQCPTTHKHSTFHPVV